MPIDPTTRPDHGPDPAENQTESVSDKSPVDPNRLSEQGDEAATAAFRDEGAYSGGDFAGGHVII